MKNHRTTALGVATLVVGASAAGSTIVSADPIPQLSPTGVPTRAGDIYWHECPDDLLPINISYDCGTIEVPLDYDQPNGAQIELGMIRRPADGPEPQGSLFVNPGGPGGSGFDFVNFTGDFWFDEEVRSNFDIIGFDPRGIGFSTALQCFDPSSGEAIPPRGDFFWPETDEEFDQTERVDELIASSCRKNAGPILDNMSTSDVARDLDVLREAVGDDELNFVGYSYGSAIGVLYANLFPDKVGAVIVDGVIDPVDWTTGVGDIGETVPQSARLDSDVGAQDTLEEFFRLCDAAGPDNCEFGTGDGSAARYRQVHDDLDESPLVIEDPAGGPPFFFDDQVLVAVTLDFLYSSFDFAGLGFILADLESQAGHTDRSEPCARVASTDHRVLLRLRTVSRSDMHRRHRAGRHRRMEGCLGQLGRLLRSPVGTERHSVCIVARCRRRPVLRSVHHRDGQPRPGGQHRVRPGHRLLRRTGGSRAAPELVVADGRWMGSHHAGPLGVRRRHRPHLPPDPRSSRDRHGL